MGEIPEARRELERLSQSLRTQLTELVTRLTPQARDDLFMPSEPKVADWHEPLRYQYSAIVRAELSAADDPETIARQAGELLTGAGWATTEEQVADGANRFTVVTGRHEGNVIEIRLPHQSSSVLYSGRTPAVPLYTAEERPTPEPVRTPDTVTSGYVLCYECDGLGWCPTCRGRGWIADAERGQRPCPECLRERVCPICRGAGELYIADLRPQERALYPELRETPQ